VQAGGSVDADNPPTPEISLPLFPVAVGEVESTNHRFFGSSEDDAF
jgi:hypothetical protein